jgi:hypothetical protein
MSEKEKLPSERETEERNLKTHIHVLRGLINYHERMMAAVSYTDLSCKKDGTCPAITFTSDVYLEALKASLALMERELGKNPT